MDPLRARLEEAASRLTPLKEGATWRSTAAVHLLCFKEEFKRAGEISPVDLLEISNMVADAACWPPECVAELQRTLSTACPQATRREMQNFENLHFYFTTAVWDRLQSPCSVSDKMKQIFRTAFALGARCPSEATKKNWCALLLTVHPDTCGFSEDAMRKTLAAEWKKFVRNAKPPSSWVRTLPSAFEEFAKDHPALFEDALGASKPEKPRVTEASIMLQMHGMGCRSRSSSSSTQLVPAGRGDMLQNCTTGMQPMMVQMMSMMMGCMRQAMTGQGRRDDRDDGVNPLPPKRKDREGEIDIKLLGKRDPAEDAGEMPALRDAGAGGEEPATETKADTDGTHALMRGLAERDAARAAARAARDAEKSKPPKTADARKPKAAGKAKAKAKGKPAAKGKAKAKAAHKAPTVAAKAACKKTGLGCSKCRFAPRGCTTGYTKLVRG